MLCGTPRGSPSRRHDAITEDEPVNASALSLAEGGLDAPDGLQLPEVTLDPSEGALSPVMLSMLAATGHHTASMTAWAPGEAPDVGLEVRTVSRCMYERVLQCLELTAIRKESRYAA